MAAQGTRSGNYKCQGQCGLISDCEATSTAGVPFWDQCRGPRDCGNTSDFTNAYRKHRVTCCGRGNTQWIVTQFGSCDCCGWWFHLRSNRSNSDASQEYSIIECVKEVAYVQGDLWPRLFLERSFIFGLLKKKKTCDLLISPNHASLALLSLTPSYSSTSFSSSSYSGSTSFTFFFPTPSYLHLSPPLSSVSLFLLHLLPFLLHLLLFLIFILFNPPLSSSSSSNVYR